MASITMHLPAAYHEWGVLIRKAEQQSTAELSDEAIHTLTEALTWIERRAPTEVMLQVHSIESIAATFSDSGRSQEALPWYERSIALLRASLSGRDRIEIANSLSSYAKAQLKAGDFVRASGAVNEACDIYAEYLGKQHVFIAIVRLTLARVERQQGNHLAAILIARESAATLREHQEHHDNLVWSLHEIGLNEAALGRFQDAELTFRQSLRAGEGLVGGSASKGNVLIQDINLDLADAMAAQGKSREAQQIAWVAIGQLEKHLTSLSPQLLEAKRRAQILFSRTGANDEAELVAVTTEEDLLENFNLANKRWRHLYCR